MTCLHPTGRPTAAEALQRLRDLRSKLPTREELSNLSIMQGDWYPLVMRGPLREMYELATVGWWSALSAYVQQLTRSRYDT